MPNPDGSLTPEEQAIAAGGQPQAPPDGTLTNPQAFINPQGAPAPAPIGAPGPLLDFQPPAQAAPAPSSVDSVPLQTTPMPKGAVKSETTVPSPEMRQGYERGQAVNKDEQKLAADAGKTNEDEARIKQDTAEAVDNESARQYAEQQAELQAQKDARDARERQYQSDIAEAKALARAPNGPDSDPAWKKNLSALSVVLGQMGRASLGGENPGQRMLDDRIKRDFDNRKQALESRYKELEITHGYNTDLENAAKDDYAKLLAGQRVRMDNLLKHGEAQLTALGVPRAQIATNATIQALQQKAAEVEEAYGKVISSKVEAKPGAGIGAGSGSSGALSILQQFARQNPGPENTSKVTALAEKLFPAMKPAQLQNLVGGAIKLDADAASNGRNQPPKLYHDELTGQDLPVDAAKTDRQAHDHAKTILAPVNTFLKTAQDLLNRSKEPTAPSWVAKFGSDRGAANAEAQADVTRLRSAYAKAKGESIGAENAHELAKAIPDVPTWPATDASMANWRRVTQRYVDEMKDLRSENLANAGVAPSAAVISGRPAARVAGPADVSEAMKWAKANPGDPRSAKILAKIGGE